MNKNKEIPSVDMTAFLRGSDYERNKIGRLVDDICREIGFLKIVNHNIDEKMIDKMWLSVESFFSLPIEYKNKYRPDDKNSPRGYFPIKSETLSKSKGVDTPPDLKEAFSIGPINDNFVVDSENSFFYGENVWPEQPPDFRSVWKHYYKAMENLSLDIMSLFAISLNLKKDYFDKFYTHHASALRALNYPPTKTKNNPNQQRAGAHTDYGSLTILLPDPDVGGLEVMRKDNNWVPITSEKNTFIINIGDMMARWTNDRWISTLHRVTGNESEMLSPKKRQSIAYFQNPNFDAAISCLPTCTTQKNKPKYDDVKAGQYLMNRFKATVN